MLIYESYSTYNAGLFNDGCLAPVTEAYLNSFCDGFTGQMLSLDQQCTLSYGPGSVRRTESNSVSPRSIRSYISSAILNVASKSVLKRIRKTMYS